MCIHPDTQKQGFGFLLSTEFRFHFEERSIFQESLSHRQCGNGVLARCHSVLHGHDSHKQTLLLLFGCLHSSTKGLGRFRALASDHDQQVPSLPKQETEGWRCDGRGKADGGQISLMAPCR